MVSLLKNELRRLRGENLRPGSPAGYLVAFTCVAVAALAQVAIGRFVNDVSPSIAYYPAIFVAALLGGVRAGVMAAVMSVVLGWWGFDTQFFDERDFIDRTSVLSRSINNGLNLLAGAFIIFAAECFRRVGGNNLPQGVANWAQRGGNIAMLVPGARLSRLQRFLRQGLRPNSFEAYVFGLVCIAIASLVRFGFGWLGDIALPFACFYPAILIVSLVAGMEAALVAMLVSMAVVGWAFFPPYFSLGPPTPGQVLDIGLYLCASLLTLWLAESYRRVLPPFRDIQVGKLNFIAPIAACCSMVLLTTIILLPLEREVGADLLLIAYILPTTLIAVLYGSMFAFLTSLVSVAAAAYFLFPPKFTLYVDDPLHVTELVFFVLIAVVASNVIALRMHGVRADATRKIQGDQSLFFHGSATRGRTGVLLIHNLGGTPHELRSVAAGLAERGFTVSCCQLAGHGGTEDDLLATHWTEWYASAESALTELEKQCDVIAVGGLSVGSILALRLAALNPDRVHGLCLFAPTLRYDGWAIPWYSFLLILGVRLPFLRRLRFADPPPYGIKDEATRAMIAEPAHGEKSTASGMPRTSLGTLQESYWLTRDIRRRLASIKAPALIMHPREDDVSDLSNTIFLQRHLGGLVECLVLDDSYHLITLDRQRDIVMNRTADFLSFVERFVARRRPHSDRPRPSVVAGREYLPPARPQAGST